MYFAIRLGVLLWIVILLSLWAPYFQRLASFIPRTPTIKSPEIAMAIGTSCWRGYICIAIGSAYSSYWSNFPTSTMVPDSTLAIRTSIPTSSTISAILAVVVSITTSYCSTCSFVAVTCSITHPDFITTCCKYMKFE